MEIREKTVQIIGYVMCKNVDVNEYFDFIRKSFWIEDIKNGLENAVFPPGLVMRDWRGTVAVVDHDRRTLKRLSW